METTLVQGINHSLVVGHAEFLEHGGAYHRAAGGPATVLNQVKFRIAHHLVNKGDLVPRNPVQQVVEPLGLIQGEQDCLLGADEFDKILPDARLPRA